MGIYSDYRLYRKWCDIVYLLRRERIMFYEDYNQLWPAEVKEKYQALQALLIRNRFVENRLEVCESYEEYNALAKEIAELPEQIAAAGREFGLAELGFNMADMASSKDARFGRVSPQ